MGQEIEKQKYMFTQTSIYWRNSTNNELNAKPHFLDKEIKLKNQRPTKFELFLKVDDIRVLNAIFRGHDKKNVRHRFKSPETIKTAF